MKKVTLIALAAMCTMSLFAAPKKTADDMVAEIEASLGPVEWMYKNNLSKAKIFQEGNLYSLAQTKTKTVFTIINPMIDEDNAVQISFLPSRDIGNGNSVNHKIDELKKGDIFATYEGEATNITHLWVLKDRRTLPNVVKIENNKLSISDMSNTILRYRGWKTEAVSSVSKKNLLQGRTLWESGIGCYTISNLEKGEFSVMFINTNDRSLSEYQMYYLGYTDKSELTQVQYEEKYRDHKGEFSVTRYDSRDNKYLYLLTGVPVGYEPYLDTAIYIPDPDYGVSNNYTKECRNKIIAALKNKDFHLFLLSNNQKPYICLNENPQE